ncbi:MORN motif-containing protein [Roseofilum reptotaenium CS-1145]|uniref:MORN motif-containing protein n=1 Tax=Roseofilum reptotaenium AO1-A TaxID=1925591 RepID=A0A1L9QNP4_9CYAN|nr:MORN motif-containing protein [Roseofilum reptotaenium]MDB9517597.1 MORN motif-containing protein [Roseofilum reptotaenium CS-1145]OJJ24285.1 hypothetical protein BI308_17575 [Roseofilum reptotaenium AO1-A]
MPKFSFKHYLSLTFLAVLIALGGKPYAAKSQPAPPPNPPGGGGQLGTDEELVPNCVPNVATGKVKCSYSNGDRYQGDFLNGRPHGVGVYIFFGGNRYEGNFLNGQPHGQGVLIRADDTRFEGIFENGTLTGTANRPGTIVFSTGEVYQGSLELFPVPGNPTRQTSRPNGRGVFIFPDSSRYQGEFFQGQILGQGILVRPDGTRCQGRFFNQELDARVQCVFPDGTRYEGELRGGIPHGQGVLISPNGQRTSGRFRDGEFVN